MRQLILIIILAGLGYFGWNYYQGHKEDFPKSIPFLSKIDGSESSATTAGGQAQPAEPPAPVFVSKVKVPDAPAGAKPAAPPGFFYMLDRVSVETRNGIIAVVPGDLVKLLERKGNGKLRVTIDQADFEVKEEQVTQDPEVAQVAEKRDFEKRNHIK